MIGTQQVTVLELKRLLIVLKDTQPDVCIRYRLMGEMWLKYFVQIAGVHDEGAIFRHEASAEIIRVPFLSSIIQFEIDQKFQEYRPHFHYDVIYD